ncbi:MAG TPA: hypothetical protein VF503_13790 [Sphingobium sp.]|uniref:hypothetical protein n=1 Tax=Sphingobium sp. TaxID=1912891 RepID=UPI002ED4C95F
MQGKAANDFALRHHTRKTLIFADEHYSPDVIGRYELYDPPDRLIDVAGYNRSPPFFENIRNTHKLTLRFDVDDEAAPLRCEIEGRAADQKMGYFQLTRMRFMRNWD